MRITISGPPGSGKTTACNRLSEKLGMKAVVFGQLFRELAAEHHMTLGEFGALAEQDPSIDKAIDLKIVEVARANPDIILESRLSAYMLSMHNIPAFKVYLNANPEVRVARIGLREGETVEQASGETMVRQASEAKRYKMYYGIDIADKSVYDLEIETDNLTPGEVVDRILEAAGVITC